MIASIAGVSAACGSASDAELGSSEQPFATGLGGEPVHERATAEGLPFLRPDIILQLQAFNVATDLQFLLESRYHVDDCNFSQASATVAAEQAAAVAALNPNGASPESELLALQAFGHSLHTVQDFYAHTNWVELGLGEIVDRSLEPWPVLQPYAVLQPANVVIVEGTPPRGMALTRDHDAPYPQNAVVRVQLRRQRSLGLISGSVDFEPGDSCPRQVMMTHDELNKDRSTTAGRELQHQQALALATEQTTHEWCRLVAQTHATWGEAGTARLALWLAPGAVAPDCPGN